MNERAVLLGKSQSLVGIITEVPTCVRNKSKPTFILLNAGFIHRVGPNRLYVHLARRLAARGYITIRFDHSGIGDSLPRTDTINYAESYISEIQEVMDWLSTQNGVDRFCLLGLCSGARTSFDTACRDSRIVGAVLLNARGIGGSIDWMMYVENRWQMRELLKRLCTPRGFLKTFTGKAPYSRVAKVASNRFKNLFKRKRDLITGVSKVSLNFNALIERNTRLLWISSEWDSSQEYFKLITNDKDKSARFHELVSYFMVTDANHTFDTLPAQKQVLNTIESWALRCWSQTPLAQKKIKMPIKNTKDY